MADRQDACRNFATLEQMDETILKNINDNIKTNDYLYFLGDFCLGGIKNVYEYRKRINCKNFHITMGNHDIHIRKNRIIPTDEGYVNIQALFTSCSDLIEKKIGKEKFVMCHYPFRSWHKGRTAIMLFGHCHGNLKQPLYDNYRTMDVGIDTHPEFRPYSLDEIREIMNNKKDFNYA